MHAIYAYMPGEDMVRFVLSVCVCVPVPKLCMHTKILKRKRMRSKVSF